MYLLLNNIENEKVIKKRKGKGRRVSLDAGFIYICPLGSHRTRLKRTGSCHAIVLVRYQSKMGRCNVPDLKVEQGLERSFLFRI